MALMGPDFYLLVKKDFALLLIPSMLELYRGEGFWRNA